MKINRKILILALVVVLILVVPFVIFFGSRWKDIPPPDDSDLVLAERAVQPEYNPFPEFRELELDPESIPAINRAGDMLDGGEEMDGEFLDQLIKDQAEVLGRFDRYAAMPDWQEDQEITFDTEMNYLDEWITVASLKAVESRRALDENRIGEAFEDGLSLLGFAQGLHQAEGGFIHQLASVYIAQKGMKAMLDIIDRVPLKDENLADLDKALSSLKFSHDTFAQAYMVEYQVIKKVADDLADGTIQINRLQQGDDVDSTQPGRPPSPFFYKRNQTVEMLAESFRGYIKGIPAIRSVATDATVEKAEKFRKNTGQLYFSGNLIGRILFSIIAPSGKSLNDSFASFQMSRELLRVRIALQRYRLAHGQWPEALDDLVPEFIEKVPVDLMDGQPVRYSKENGVVYSVGIDFKDDGGTAPDRPGSLQSRKEIVIVLPAEEESATEAPAE